MNQQPAETHSQPQSLSDSFYAQTKTQLSGRWEVIDWGETPPLNGCLIIRPAGIISGRETLDVWVVGREPGTGADDALATAGRDIAIASAQFAAGVAVTPGPDYLGQGHGTARATLLVSLTSTTQVIR